MSEACKRCNDAGYIMDETDGVKSFVGFCDCPKGTLKRKESWEEKLTEAGIPKDYWNLHFENFIPQNTVIKHMQFLRDLEAYLKGIKDRREAGNIWLIYGSAGTGKTLGATLVLKEAIKKGYTCKYTVWTDLVDEVFTADDTVKSAREVDFLVIDDLGKDRILRETAFKPDLLEKIIKPRVGNKQPTILVSSLRLDDLLDLFPVLSVMLDPQRNMSHVEGMSFWKRPKP